MITTSLTWNITDLKRHSSDGFVYEIRYSVTGVSTETVGGASTTFQHVMNGGYMVPDHTRTGSEIPFDNLTETQLENKRERQQIKMEPSDLVAMVSEAEGFAAKETTAMNILQGECYNVLIIIKV